MTSTNDIYITGNMLLQQHGDKAEDVAMQKMLLMLERDDAKGATIWLSIMSAINDLRMKQEKNAIN